MRNYGRELSLYLKRMGQALLHREAEDVDGGSLNLRMLRQSCFEDRLKVTLNDSGAHSAIVNISRLECVEEGSSYPESAKPSVFPTNSSIFTSAITDLDLTLSDLSLEKDRRGKRVKERTLLLISMLRSF